MKPFTHALCPNGLTNCNEVYDPADYKGSYHSDLVKQLGIRYDELVEMLRARNAKYNGDQDEPNPIPIF